MIDLIKKLKIPAIVIVIFLLLFFVYSTFFKGGSSSTDKIESSTEAISSVPQEEQNFLNLLLKIQNISIDTSVFDNPVFASLEDDGLPVIDQPKGRRNPFAPIGADAGAAFSTTTGTNI